MSDANIPLLSEQLRPQTLAELNLPEDTIRTLDRLASSGSMMNLLFYGQPGIGKTSAARILMKTTGADGNEFNGSFNNGDKSMVKGIEGFASSMSFFGKPKICLIDEADFMPRAVQDPLRYIIERASGNCRFLLTANDLNRLTPALRSRCTPICFNVLRKDADAVIDKMVAQYEGKLKSLGFDLPRERINEIVRHYFPDLRSVANRFQMEIVAAS